MRSHDQQIRVHAGRLVHDLCGWVSFTNHRVEGHARRGLRFDEGFRVGKQLITICSRQDDRLEGNGSWAEGRNGSR